ALAGEEGGAVERTATAVRDLETAGRYSAVLAQLATELKEALAALGAVSSEVEAFLADFEADPQRLDEVQSRLAALEGLERKYGPDIPAVLEFRRTAAAELANLEGADDEIARLEEEAAALEARLTELGGVLTAARQAAGAELAAGVVPLLERLGMPHA